MSDPNSSTASAPDRLSLTTRLVVAGLGGLALALGAAGVALAASADSDGAQEDSAWVTVEDAGDSSAPASSDCPERDGSGSTDTAELRESA
ncbi:hypothetical protein ASG49_00140 [Marmoricola sp. Leaf446]|uniref:hypothetical protein n=1 Tax=Marmoricola sp. Leaf446 TaxID=1736379 RepID=UPI0006F4F727|nr:hypothetical protein [Marmoricola sp. Leaf446]KQT93476.1 hypothetical protein ASG49_00140 [Marmoricola sp. Leaf446]